MNKSLIGKIVSDSLNESIEEVCYKKELSEEEKKIVSDVVYYLVGLAYAGNSNDKSKIKEIIEGAIDVY